MTVRRVGWRSRFHGLDAQATLDPSSCSFSSSPSHPARGADPDRADWDRCLDSAPRSSRSLLGMSCAGTGRAARSPRAWLRPQYLRPGASLVRMGPSVRVSGPQTPHHSGGVWSAAVTAPPSPARYLSSAPRHRAYQVAPAIPRMPAAGPDSYAGQVRAGI